MKRQTRATRLAMRTVLLGFAAPLLLTGCGGAANHAAPTATRHTGRAILTVAWPTQAATRLIPLASRSILVRILRGDALVAQRLLLRPTDGGPTTATFEGLPVGVLRVTAEASPAETLPTPQYTAVPQAVGSAPLEIVDGESVSFKIALQSTITRIDAFPLSSEGEVNRPLSVWVSARDANGASVLVVPRQFRWTVTEGSASLNEDGQVVPREPGPLRMTITDSESGTSTTFSSTITARVPPPAPPG